MQKNNKNTHKYKTIHKNTYYDTFYLEDKDRESLFSKNKYYESLLWRHEKKSHYFRQMEKRVIIFDRKCLKSKEYDIGAKRDESLFSERQNDESLFCR